MKFVSVRDLRNHSAAIWRSLQGEDLVLTSNGKPVGVLIGVEEEDLEATMSALRRSRAGLAVSRMRAQAQRNGLDGLSGRQIQGEIASARRRRRS